jgi:hypothetical protein
MGLDAKIYFRCQKPEPELEWDLPRGYSIYQPDPNEDMPEVTHGIDMGGDRYYGTHYERGPWPTIASVLLLLFASEDVEKVWYGHDASDPSETSIKDVLELSEHFMLYGSRPYRTRP